MPWWTKAIVASVPTGGCTGFVLTFEARYSSESNRVTDFNIEYSTDNGNNWIVADSILLAGPPVAKKYEINTISTTSGTETILIRLRSSSNTVIISNAKVNVKSSAKIVLKNIVVTGLK